MLREVHPRAGSQTATTAASVGRFIAGDPLRAIAATGVVVLHLILALQVLGLPAEHSAARAVGQLSELGRLGLYLFFVLSGYLLGRPFLQAFLEGGRGPEVAGYLRNRALRIVPAFWLAVTLTIVVFGAAGVSSRQVAALYLFAQDAEPSRLSARILQGWSIGLEVCFYVALPVAGLALGAACRRLGRRGRLVVVWSLLAAAAVGSLAFQATTHGWVGASGWQRSLPAMLFAFVPGMALAVLELRAPAWLRAGRRRGRLLGRGLLAGAIVVAALQVAVVISAPRWLISVSAAAAAGALVAAALVHQWTGRGTWRALDNRLMGWLGERSYGLYLFHVLVIGFVYERVKDMPGVAAGTILVVATLAVTPVLAALSYRFVERPFLSLRHRWRSADPTPAPTLPSAAVPPAIAVPPPAARGA